MDLMRRRREMMQYVLPENIVQNFTPFTQAFGHFTHKRFTTKNVFTAGETYHIIIDATVDEATRIQLYMGTLMGNTFYGEYGQNGVLEGDFTVQRTTTEAFADIFVRAASNTGKNYTATVRKIYVYKK